MSGCPEKDRLKILFVAAEVAPYAKTGGLADVAGALPLALKDMGHDVRIVLPRYQVVDHQLVALTDFAVDMAGRKETAIVKENRMKVNNCTTDDKYLPVYFIENYHFFDRPHLYMYGDEAERFAFFSKAVLEMLPKLDFQPDVIHCNDWQSGPVAVLLKEKYRQQPFYSNIGVLFTIHNIMYQGKWPKYSLNYLGLGEEYFVPDKLEFYGDINFLKAGVVYADLINTVSKRYAEEIKTDQYGEGMQGLLQQRSADLFGIVNGIDFCEFNPMTDQKIFRNYGVENVAVKVENKHSLQKELGLPQKDVPLLGLVSRLVDQKGLDLIVAIMNRLMDLDVQLVVQGLGDKYYEDFFTFMQAKYPDKVSAKTRFDVTLAQRIYAGSDIFLMPSRFEPCGLGQLIALRYGTIPVVRATGGLFDTITDYQVEADHGNGFSFSDYSADALWETINRTLEVYSQPEEWLRLVKHALAQDNSWTKSAKEYERLYYQIQDKVAK